MKDARAATAGRARYAAAVALAAALTATPFARDGAAAGARLSAEERAGLALLDSIEAAQRTLTDLSARFTETAFQAVFEESLTSRGEVFFRKPGRLLLRYAAPDSSLLVVNERTVWLYHVPNRQAHRFRLSEESTAYGLLFGFGGSFRDARKHFRFLAEKAATRHGERVLRAVPIAESPAAEDLEEIVVAIDPKRWLPVRTRFREKGGDERLFVFEEVRRNPGVREDLFSFTPPEGVEVFDMESE